jgi:hypothetical protein
MTNRIRFFIGIFVAVLAAFATDAAAQTQPVTGQSPRIEITKVTSQVVANEIKFQMFWTADAPREITLARFDIQFEATLSNGSKRSASKTADFRSRSEDFRFPIESVVTAVSYRVTIDAPFTFTTSGTVVKDIDLRDTRQIGRPPQNSAAPAPARPGVAPKEGPPVVNIVQADFSDRGCSNTQDCLDVRWTLIRPQATTINGFTAIAEVTYEVRTGPRQAILSKETRRAAKTLNGAAETQARLVVNNPPRAATAIQLKVSVTTSFSTPGRQRVTKEAKF